jgi:hypothetical protein
MDNKNTRTAQIRKDGQWVDISPENIKAGDLFRMFEPDGTPIPDSNGNHVWNALKDAYFLVDGVLCVEHD